MGLGEYSTLVQLQSTSAEITTAALGVRLYRVTVRTVGAEIVPKASCALDSSNCWAEAPKTAAANSMPSEILIIFVIVITVLIDTKIMKNRFIELLEQLIATPSPSGQEEATAQILVAFLQQEGVDPIEGKGNNVWAVNKYFDAQKQTVLLCSHHDTVAPSTGWSYEPYAATRQDGKIFGLGSNDAGASVVALTAAFLHFYDRADLPFNLCLALVAEEERSGEGGLRSILDQLPKLWFALVGEPTAMDMAVGERGLLVLDGVAHGKAGHAARGEGVNAIYEALKDIVWIKNHRFERNSELFGAVTANVTMIEAGSVHNVVPDTCRFVVDVRVNEQYTLEEVLETIRTHVQSEITPRSMRWHPSRIALDHPIVAIGTAMGIAHYGSPTTSDATVLSPLPCLKMGPGDSARSHTADEYITVQEIEQGIEQYIRILEQLDRR